MIIEVIELIASIIIILIGCELFANAVEHIGRKFSLSHAAAGSLLAAIGTAMPETLIPILALIFGGEYKEDISIGAILGAPFMLLTLALFLVGITIIIAKFLKRRETTIVNVNPKILNFDIKFFIIAFSFVIIGTILWNITNYVIIKYILAILLLILYIYYIKVTLSHPTSEKESYEEFFYLQKYFSMKPKITNAYLQLLLGLILIIFGAKLFIGYLTLVGTEIGIPMLILSLLITPIATELPEKYNSITWTWRGKDTLGMGNITGAVAFQSTVVVCVGLILTEWKLEHNPLLNILFALISGILIYLTLKIKKKIPAELFIIMGILYVLYIIISLFFKI
ncbi:MAG: sodium:calcium antiporter [Candidatus Altarchaeaceae archaeon]